MKKSLIAGLVAPSFGISVEAYAKNLNAVDVLVGDFVGIATIDVDKLAANKMIGDTLNKHEGKLNKELTILKSAGIDYKKDIDMITFAVTDKGQSCYVLDAKKSMVDVVPKIVAAHNEQTVTDYNGLPIYNISSVQMAVVGEKRVIGCQGIDIRPSIDNAKAKKPSALKERNSTLNSMYSQLASSADIRIAGKMSTDMRKHAKGAKLDSTDGKSTVNAIDIDAGSIAISFASGLDIKATAKMKSAEIATAGASILTENVNVWFSDKTIKDLGLSFLADSIKFNSDDKNIKGQIKLDNNQLAALVVLLSGIFGDV